MRDGAASRWTAGTTWVLVPWLFCHNCGCLTPYCSLLCLNHWTWPLTFHKLLEQANKTFITVKLLFPEYVNFRLVLRRDWFFLIPHTQTDLTWNVVLAALWTAAFLQQLTWARANAFHLLNSGPEAIFNPCVICINFPPSDAKGSLL